MNPLHAVPPVWSPISRSAIQAGRRAGCDSVASLASLLGSEYSCSEVVLTASGTVALALAIGGARSKSSRPTVALPAYACFDLATAADTVDAAVRLYDVDPQTLSPEPTSYRRALSAGVDVVVLAHLFGIPVDPEFFEEARRAGVIVIDDAAQGDGGSIDGRPLGTFGDLGILSFGRGKGRTGGGGGALLGISERGVAIASAAADSLGKPAPGFTSVYAKLWAQWLFGRPGWYRIPTAIPWLKLGETVYHSPPVLEAIRPGSAEVVRAVDPLLPSERSARCVGAVRWARELAGLDRVGLVTVAPDRVAGWLRFPITVRNDLRSTLSGAAARRLGVMAGYPCSLAILESFENRVRGPKFFPLAGLLAEQLLTLPTHSRVAEPDRAAILRLVRGSTR